MSGHSKWSTIKRKKGAADAKRGAIFTRLAREITIAAREGGDPDVNFRLRLAVDKARAENMPKDNIERAIKKGTGDDKEGVAFEELTLEGYGPHGSAILASCVTDNRNRTISEVRHAFSKSGGNMAEAGAVAWQFDRKSYFSFPSNQMSYEKAFDLAVVAGADDVVDGGEEIEIFGPVEAFKTIADALHQVNVQPAEAGLRMIPKQELELGVEETLQVLKVVEGIEDLDDVQDVYHNVKVSDEVIAALEAA
ncbi:MAG: YebC/PmpR family DNA-binding transcriptional regulator [Anaerolineales bacterium]|nr:YebC/PmpR family DNA-binding transcriptional regulator [Anaerolineales bacterium]WKZ41209.1 MAG: YebC/PmpR family DNA-binding transcriptional regulator [Anaerolineales bacterium]